MSANPASSAPSTEPQQFLVQWVDRDNRSGEYVTTARSSEAALRIVKMNTNYKSLSVAKFEDIILDRTAGL